jgi:hypothetical protein
MYFVCAKKRWDYYFRNNHVTCILSVQKKNTDEITGLSAATFRDNWNSDYQPTNNAGVPDPNGSISWDFK